MGYTVEYDKYYKEDKKACGEPFSEIINFLESKKGKNLKALDLGCGQGRDSIPMAQMGYSVIGVDVSKVGLEQLDEISRKNKFKIKTIVGDIIDFKTRERFDVIVVDRVLHILPDSEERETILSRCRSYLKKGGVLLIADTPQNISSFKSYVKKNLKDLKVIFDKKNYLFYEK